jgi:hypothetical protein
VEQRLLPEVAAPALLGPVGRRHRHRPGPHAFPSLSDHGTRSSQIRIGRGKNRADEGGDIGQCGAELELGSSCRERRGGRVNEEDWRMAGWLAA